MRKTFCVYNPRECHDLKPVLALENSKRISWLHPPTTHKFGMNHFAHISIPRSSANSTDKEKLLDCCLKNHLLIETNPPGTPYKETDRSNQRDYFNNRVLSLRKIFLEILWSWI